MVDSFSVGFKALHVIGCCRVVRHLRKCRRITSRPTDQWIFVWLMPYKPAACQPQANCNLIPYRGSWNPVGYTARPLTTWRPPTRGRALGEKAEFWIRNFSYWREFRKWIDAPDCVTYRFNLSFGHFTYAYAKSCLAWSNYNVRKKYARKQVQFNV